MSVTASRLGHSPLTLDWSNLARIAPAASARTPQTDPAAFKDVWARLKSRFDQGEIGFYGTPILNELSQARESQALADELLGRDQFTDCLFLGIGGSALGPSSLLASLVERRTNQIRFHFMDNPDPLDWSTTLRGLNPDTTLVCVVAKSGTTFETISQLLLALEWLGKPRWPSHLVAITDPEKGDLKEFARLFNVPTLHIAPSVGGRFSIFTPVGLFAAALAGLSIKDFLLGAQQIREYVDKAPAEKNPLFIVGADLIRHFSKRPIHVCMPYSTRLKSMGSWFAQLWGESLGKEGKGFTPLAALGATDQHSILQLLRDGPDDKVVFFMTVDKVATDVRVPKLFNAIGGPRLPAFALMEGHSLHELLAIEYRAISLVLTKQSRPHLTFQLDCLDERSLGATYFAYCVMTAFTGTLWQINPFDQPGVEEGKVYIRQALSNEPASRAAEEDTNSPVARLRRE